MSRRQDREKARKMTDDARPDRGRRFSRDMVPPGAYWRALSDVEMKADFPRLEAQEGRRLTGRRVRLGIVLAAQMEAFVAWARRPSFTPAALRRIPLFLADEVGDEFARAFVQDYLDGVAWFDDMKARQLERSGIDPSKTTGKIFSPGTSPEVSLSRSLTRQLLENARRLSVDIVRGIAIRLAPVFESAWGPDGRRLKSSDQIATEIRAIYASYIEESDEDLTDVDLLQLSAPPGLGGLEHFLDSEGVLEATTLQGPFRLRGDALSVEVLLGILGRHDLIGLAAPKRPAWERGLPEGKRRARRVRPRKTPFVPFSKWMKKSVEEIQSEGRKAVRLKKDKAARYLQTERTRYFAHGAIQRAQADPDCRFLVYSAIRDSRTCEVCLALDGITLPKGHPRWAFITPPMHHSCRCSIVPAFRWEDVSTTTAAEMREIDEEIADRIAPGFGVYSPEKAKSAKRLGITPPKGPASNKAIRSALGKDLPKAGSPLRNPEIRRTLGIGLPRVGRRP